MLTPHQIQILAIRQNQINNKNQNNNKRGAPGAPLSCLKYKWELLASATNDLITQVHALLLVQFAEGWIF